MDKYIFFWKPNEVNGIFSQWYNSKFKDEINGKMFEFPTAEHYMMWRKALLFNDEDIAEKILNTKDPKTVKSLGRKVRNFDEKIWMDNNFDIVVRGNMLKFGQNESLKTKLLQTNDKILAEASPYDKLWGIGMNTSNKSIYNMDKWLGKNLLGKALMKVRKNLQKIDHQIFFFEK